MLKTKFNRQTIAFLTIVLASILLYPLAQAGLEMYMRSFLALIILAASLTLMTK